MKKRPCTVCGCGPSDPDHRPTRGSRGGDHDLVWPLCREHHTEAHQVGIKSFERKYSISASYEIDRLWVEYTQRVREGRSEKMGYRPRI